MGRFQAIQQLTRCARRLSASDSSSLVPARLLSNSQASTSAADGSEQSRSSAERKDVHNRQPSGPSQRPGNAGANPQTDETSSLKGTGLSGLLDASDDFEPGFVADGAYPYAASEVEITHLGGSTETAWEFLGSVDEQAVTWFGMDFTRGTHPEVERNALLSDAAKEMMYQMHKQDDKRYTVPLLASKFKIRQQRVMAILALKGMEHGEIPVHPGKRKPKTASSAAPPATQAETSISDSSTAQASALEAEEQLDVRGQAVKAAMDEAATDIPRYLDNIAKKSESWQLQSTVGTPEQQATDSNILTAWIKSMVNDPFWVRPGKDEEEEEEPVPDTAELEDIQDDETMSKADAEAEQQYLQDYYQHEQQSRTSAGAPQEADTPRDEGYERYLLSQPEYLHDIMEHDVWECHEAQGTGERHVKFIPKYPKFEFFKDDSANTRQAEEQAAAGGHPDIERPVISFWEEANLMQAEQEEAHLVREFKERLRYNLQQEGANLDRRSRTKHAPSRPAEGWSMVVQDISKADYTQQYVAMPNGKTRSLNADEKVYLERRQPKRRKHIV